MPNLKELLLCLARSDFLNSAQRIAIYRWLGMQVGIDVVIQSGVRFTQTDLSSVTLGDRAFINHDCFIDNSFPVLVGSSACIAPRVTILTTTHDIGESQRRTGDGCVRMSVSIGSGSWVGAGATILPGANIGQGCIIAAGSLVNRSCEPNGLYAGVPAKRIRELE